MTSSQGNKRRRRRRRKSARISQSMLTVSRPLLATVAFTNPHWHQLIPWSSAAFFFFFLGGKETIVTRTHPPSPHPSLSSTTSCLPFSVLLLRSFLPFKDLLSSPGGEPGGGGGGGWRGQLAAHRKDRSNYKTIQNHFPIQNWRDVQRPTNTNLITSTSLPPSAHPLLSSFPLPHFLTHLHSWTRPVTGGWPQQQASVPTTGMALRPTSLRWDVYTLNTRFPSRDQHLWHHTLKIVWPPHTHTVYMTRSCVHLPPPLLSLTTFMQQNMTQLHLRSSNKTSCGFTHTQRAPIIHRFKWFYKTTLVSVSVSKTARVQHFQSVSNEG